MYYLKYLKYKQKYLRLKTELEGGLRSAIKQSKKIENVKYNLVYPELFIKFKNILKNKTINDIIFKKIQPKRLDNAPTKILSDGYEKILQNPNPELVLQKKSNLKINYDKFKEMLFNQIMGLNNNIIKDRITKLNKENLSTFFKDQILNCITDSLNKCLLMNILENSSELSS